MFIGTREVSADTPPEEVSNLVFSLPPALPATQAPPPPAIPENGIFSFPAPPEAIASYLEKARNCIQQGHYNEAVTPIYEAFEQLDSSENEGNNVDSLTKANIHYLLGYSYSGCGAYGFAALSYTEAAEIMKPHSPEVAAKLYHFSANCSNTADIPDLAQKGYKAAVEQFELAVKLAPNDDHQIKADLYACQASCYAHLKDNEKAERTYHNAAREYIACKQYDAASTMFRACYAHMDDTGISRLREKMEEQLQEQIHLRSTPEYDQVSEIHARRCLAYLTSITDETEIYLEHQSTLYYLQQGPLVTGAEDVKEQEIGLSGHIPLGTSNIQQCTVVIIRDPATRKTALAHVNFYTNAASLDKHIKDNFPPDAPLEVHLVGSRAHTGPDIAWGNLDKIMGVLKPYPNITLKSADIWRNDTPSSIVFYPETGTLAHGVVLDTDRYHSVRCDNVRTNTQSLHLAFDFTQEKTACYPYYYPDSYFQQFLPCRLIDDIVASTHASIPVQQPEEWIANSSFVTIGVNKENIRISKELAETATKRLCGQYGGIPVSKKMQETALDFFLKQGKYLGPNAENYNMPLIEKGIALLHTELHLQQLSGFVQRLSLSPRSNENFTNQIQQERNSAPSSLILTSAPARLETRK